MADDKFVRMDRELTRRLRLAGTVLDRERLVIEKLLRKEAMAATDNVVTLPVVRVERY